MSFKKILLVSLLTITAFFCFPFFIHNEILDYFNPALPETKSYAQGPQNVQHYYNVQAYDSNWKLSIPIK